MPAVSTASRGARALRRRAARSLPLLAALLLAASPAASKPPPEGECPDFTGGARPGVDGDGGVPLVEEGNVLRLGDLARLKSLLPKPVWSQRSAFFYEGMRMEIGACHRRYPTASFYRSATEKFAGEVSLDEEGGLHGYVAGTPFPPDSIDPDDPQAGTRWAWNYLYRYVGAGPVGKFRLVDMPSRLGTPHTYRGEFFWVRTAHRADLAASGYQTPEADGTVWVAGGRFQAPFNARHLAWRQLRPRETEQEYDAADDTFVYVPTMRKPRRAATTWVDGLFTPRYSVSGDSGAGGGVAYGSGGGEYNPGLKSVNPTAGLSIAATENIRRGFTGLALRPNAYEWTLVGETEVLAPLNASRQGWPSNPDRNYGPSGLSVASDRWDVRQAVVIQGLARRRVDDVAAVKLWIDYQTRQPLYMVTRRENGLLLEVGILVHRFSGGRPDYPAFPGGEAAKVFDPVAASFYHVPGGGAGWRRESYDVRSLPVEPDRLRELTSVGALSKGR